MLTYLAFLIENLGLIMISTKILSTETVIMIIVSLIVIGLLSEEQPLSIKRLIHDHSILNKKVVVIPSLQIMMMRITQVSFRVSGSSKDVVKRVIIEL